MTEGERTRPALRPPGRYPHRTWWLLARSERCRTEVLTVNGDGERTLPAFSGEGEAELFLFLGKETFGRGWHVRETSAGELVSLLSGPYAGVRSVALDPMPGMAEAGTIGLVSVGRSRFVSRSLPPSGINPPQPWANLRAAGLRDAVRMPTEPPAFLTVCRATARSESEQLRRWGFETEDLVSRWRIWADRA